jgi:hypothetical protein
VRPAASQIAHRPGEVVPDDSSRQGGRVRALLLNSTPQAVTGPSNTEALGRVVIQALEGHGVTTELVRVAD